MYTLFGILNLRCFVLLPNLITCCRVFFFCPYLARAFKILVRNCVNKLQKNLINAYKSGPFRGENLAILHSWNFQTCVAHCGLLSDRRWSRDLLMMHMSSVKKLMTSTMPIHRPVISFARCIFYQQNTRCLLLK